MFQKDRFIDACGVAVTEDQKAVRELVQAEINRSNSQLAQVESVRAFRLFPKELHQDDGELTATQKVRRREITKIWSPLIEEIYA